MKLKKKVIRGTVALTETFKAYRCNIELYFVRYIKSANRFIYEVIPQPGCDTNLLSKKVKDVQRVLGIPFLQLFDIDHHTFLAVASSGFCKYNFEEILTSETYLNCTYQLPVALGYNLIGDVVIADLHHMNHVLYTGASGSGKSNGLRMLIMGMICYRPVSELNFLLFDIGGGSLDLFADIPHLSHSIVKDYDTAVYVINCLFEEMERRLKMKECEPEIVVVIDEVFSFIRNATDPQIQKQLQHQITELLSRGRKTNIHFVLATQNSTYDGTAIGLQNITSHMVFKIGKPQTAHSLIGESGPTKLTTPGSMYFKSGTHNDAMYIQSADMKDFPFEKYIRRINECNAGLVPEFTIPEQLCMNFEITDDEVHDATPVSSPRVSLSEFEKRLAKSVELALTREDLSGKKLRDTFHITQNDENGTRAIMKQLTDWKIVSEPHGKLPRTVLIKELTGLPFEALKLLNDAKLITQEKFAQVLEEQKRLASVTGVNDEIASDDDVGTVMESDS